MNDDEPMNVDTGPYFEIEIVVRGAEIERETMSGLRADRPVLARIEVPVEAPVAWSVYRHALDEIIAPTARIRYLPPEYLPLESHEQDPSR